MTASETARKNQLTSDGQLVGSDFTVLSAQFWLHFALWIIVICHTDCYFHTRLWRTACSAPGAALARRNRLVLVPAVLQDSAISTSQTQRHYRAHYW